MWHSHDAEVFADWARGKWENANAIRR